MRSEVESQEELLFTGRSKPETKSNRWRKGTILSSQTGKECDDL